MAIVKKSSAVRKLIATAQGYFSHARAEAQPYAQKARELAVAHRSLLTVALVVVAAYVFGALFGESTFVLAYRSVFSKLVEGRKLQFSHFRKTQLLAEHDEQFISARYEELVKLYLGPFARSSGIYPASYMGIYARESCTECFMIQIVDGTIWLVDPRRIHRRGGVEHQMRMREALEWVKLALKDITGRGEFVDGIEFVVSVADPIQSTDTTHTYNLPESDGVARPVFSVARCDVSSNIPFPMSLGESLRDAHPDGFMYRKGIQPQEWDERMVDLGLEDSLAMEKKKPKAVFSGKVAPSSMFADESRAEDACGQIGASAIDRLSRKERDLVEARVRGRCGLECCDSGDGEAFVTPALQQQYLFNIHTEEERLWSNRLPWILFSSSCPLISVLPCGQWFEPLLKAFVHYIPVDMSMANLTRTVREWRQKRETYDVMRESQVFARDYLRVDAITMYVRILLLEYLKLQKVRRNEPDPNAIRYFPTYAGNIFDE
ncbi:hypothetical protein FVE85_0292 [Porphyridium purpureum]|uniref:Glycosyl transferase CAP10 domain-containing protein n=1 Tax=Porphyridium purpureum TaxID=35688 RepID=A0A5J4Z129_PORPP|nr:hypothetical protein FVE85_0292 [Porphyridium purpureum]|eukprot:POR6855..scf208_2